MSKKKKIFIVIISVIFALVLLAYAYLFTGNYKAESIVLRYLDSTDNVSVTETEDAYYFDGPGEDIAIIFYPGGKVDYKAYARLMFRIAESGKDCFLVKMPLNIAFFGTDKANKIIDKYKYNEYYISGHSLGGVVACNYAVKNADKIKGIINFASYPTKKLPSEMKYISFYGSEDKVLNKKKYEKAKKYLPDNGEEYIIKGGNHSGFGNYGEQKNDGKATISNEEQQNYVVEILLELK